MANIEVARKEYSNDNVIFTFDDGREMTAKEMTEYRKSHFVVIV